MTCQHVALSISVQSSSDGRGASHDRRYRASGECQQPIKPALVFIICTAQVGTCSAYLDGGTTSQAALELEQGAANLVAERGLALLDDGGVVVMVVVDGRSRDGGAATAGEETTAAGRGGVGSPGSGAGGAAVVSERHVEDVC